MTDNQMNIAQILTRSLIYDISYCDLIFFLVTITTLAHVTSIRNFLVSRQEISHQAVLSFSKWLLLTDTC